MRLLKQSGNRLLSPEQLETPIVKRLNFLQPVYYITNKNMLN
jgi:hypothetical protein